MMRWRRGVGAAGKAGSVIAMLVAAGMCAPALAEGPVMIAHFIDVGQADATLLEFPCGALLIDAGAQDNQQVSKLLGYLTDFFARRTDLNKTLDSIIITHNHIDHTRALREIVEKFKVKHYVDNGQLDGPGSGDPNWVRTNAHTDDRDISVGTVVDTQITDSGDTDGVTNDDIDPIKCNTCDPRIAILSGRLTENPGWPHRKFDNKNNHSLVARIDFGESSFLFTGDMEEDAIETFVDWYDDTTTLDVDVYQMGHHGSHNATTVSLIEAMTPEIAVISAGKWDFGRNTTNQYSTWYYGHPRRVTVDLLTLAIRGRRSSPPTVKLFDRPQSYREYKVRKRIYATSWDGTVRVRASLTGRFRVTRNQ